jgi:SAM-dependent methyltransferase
LDNYRKHYGERWPGRLKAADSVISLLQAVPPARILDLACGGGAVTAAMALKGFDVTGIDCTPGAIDLAARMSSRKGASVQWLCQDMRLIDYREEFDFVCLRDVIFGIFEDEREDADLIRRIGQALKPGGRLLLEVYNKEFAVPRGIEGCVFYDKRNDRFMPKDGGAPWPAGMKLYTHEELNNILRKEGLTIVKMDGWKWETDPPPPPWRADIIVAVKTCRSEALGVQGWNESA